MKTSPPTLQDLEGVFAVPPLARTERGGPDDAENDRVAAHVRAGGISRLLYGGNAFLYHVTLAEYEALLDWMARADGDVWMIPSLGPSFGRAMEQAGVLRRHRFPAAMLLPCSDPRDAAGLERGIRRIADLAGVPLILYLKEETTFGPDLDRGLDAVARLIAEGICVAIKYAVVREDPAADAYLAGLVSRVDRRRIVSGIGERPAVVHMRQWSLPGFTTGSGCVAPRLTARLFDACARSDFARAEDLRRLFLPLEDVRDAEGPARVLHAAVDACGIASIGAISPFVSEVEPAVTAIIARTARELYAANERAMCEV